jgi:hypothetical protein
VAAIRGSARRGHGSLFQSDPAALARLNKVFCIHSPEVIVLPTVGANSEVFQSRNLSAV